MNSHLQHFLEKIRNEKPYFFDIDENKNIDEELFVCFSKINPLGKKPVFFIPNNSDLTRLFDNYEKGDLVYPVHKGDLHKLTESVQQFESLKYLFDFHLRDKPFF